MNLLDVVHHLVLLQPSVRAEGTLPQIDVEMSQDVDVDEELLGSLRTADQTFHLGAVVLVQTADLSVKTATSHHAALLCGALFA